MKGMRETKMREIRFKLSGMVLKTEKELVLENESTKGKGVCGTQERRRERRIRKGKGRWRWKLHCTPIASSWGWMLPF